MFKKVVTLSFVFAVFLLGTNKVSAVEGPVEEIFGCTHVEAINFNPAATIDNESCVFEEEEPEVILENTSELCHDLIDNDGDESTDEADVDCAEFFAPVVEAPVLENTSELCHDLIDNDGDESTDEADVDCAEFFAPVVEVVPETTTRRSSSGSRSGGNGGSSSGGEVLGASTDDITGGVCELPYIKTFLKRGQANDVEDVKKLQTFLNKHLGLSIPVTGFFGPLTEAGVKAFQLKYKDSVLAPWVKVGSLVNDTTATGYVYKTTIWKIHTIICPTQEIPQPSL